MTRSFARFQRLGLLAFLLLMGLLFTLMSPYFLTLTNLTNILIQSAVLLTLATGMTLVIATAGIDLSMGAVLALSGIVTAGVLKSGAGILAGLAAGLASGALMGLLNGLGIAYLNITPFIITLGTMGVYRALGLIFTQAQPIYGLPMSFRLIGTGRVGAIPLCIIVAAGVVGLGWFLISQTRFGANLRAVGDKEQAAFRLGVPLPRIRLMVYALSGLIAATAGLIITARLNTAEAIAGMGLEMEAIAAVIMGGTSFQGGEAKISGSVLGALILGTLQNGLTIVNVPSYWQQLCIGLIFIMAVMADQLRRRGGG